jgi:hypothetical protein
MQLEFSGPVWYWRGPAPFHFVTVPPDEAALIESVSKQVSYGWGMVPATVTVGATTTTTALWPKNGGYIVPLKDAVRRAEGIEIDDEVAISLTIDA